MITYLIKSTFSLTLLYAAYYILFSRMKSFRLNRYILLISVIFSLLFPLISISFDVPAGKQMPVSSDLIRTVNVLNGVNQRAPMLSPGITDAYYPFRLENIFLAIYFIISLILLIRFIKNIWWLINRLKKYEKAEYRNNKIILLDEDIVPHSFINSIIMSKKDFENESVDKSLVNHEIAHIRQHHSIDVILIELISIFYWFNPLIYLFRSAIKLNHEYLADEYASENETTISDYSHKLINFSSRGKSLYLTSGLNFSLIKKRISMLSSKNRINYLTLRLAVMISITIGLFLFTACVFNTSSSSGNNIRTPDPINTTSGTSTSYRINDSTYYFYGDFTVISGTEKTKIKAHRLKLSIEFSKSKNYFENDFLNGRVYTDGVDVYTNRLFLDKIISYKADHIEGSPESNIIRLKGNAEIKGEDLKLQSGEITLHLSQWKKI